MDNNVKLVYEQRKMRRDETRRDRNNEGDEAGGTRNAASPVGFGWFANTLPFGSAPHIVSFNASMSTLSEIDLTLPSDGEEEATPKPLDPKPTRSSSNHSLRGSPSYLFSVKRSRRNAKRRAYNTVAAASQTQQLESIGEEKDLLLGTLNSPRRSPSHPSCAPKLALVLFLFVCSVGTYRGISDYFLRVRNNSTSPRVLKDVGVRSSFRSSSGVDHLGAMLQQLDDAQHIAETPIILFNRTYAAPPQLANLANVFEEPYNPTTNKLFLWHVPRSGSTTIKRIVSNCASLNLASEAGKGEGSEDVLRIIEGMDGMHFANVDMSNPAGIARAKSLNVGSSDTIDLVSSPYLYDAASVFDSMHRGYTIAMFRHPIERAVSLFYAMKMNKNYANVVGTLDTVEQYARSSLVENNWLTRFLSNTLSGPLRPENEAVAKEVLRTKVIIGLLCEKTESMRRLETLFNMKSSRSRIRDECQEKLLYWDWPGKNRHDPIVEGSDAWEKLKEQNTFDLRLYEYAEQLFIAQRKLFAD